MGKIRVPEFRIPAPPGQSGWAILIALALNVAAIGALAWTHRASENEDVFAGLAALFDNSRENANFEMIYLTPLEAVPDPGGAEEVAGDVVDETVEELLPELPQDVEEGVVAEEEEPVVEELVPLVEEVPTESPTQLSDIVVATVLDSIPRPVVVGTHRRLGPSYGDGRVWAPIVLTEGERTILAVSVAAIDSLMRERLLAAIREIPPDSFAMEGGPQSWMTRIAGQNIGIDGQFITLGPLKIPTFLLAFLPMNLPETNIFDQRDKRRYEEIRQEIIRQSQRMADTKRVKGFIEDMRERLDDERLRRRAGTVADSLVSGQDSIIGNR